MSRYRGRANARKDGRVLTERGARESGRITSRSEMARSGAGGRGPTAADARASRGRPVGPCQVSAWGVGRAARGGERVQLAGDRSSSHTEGARGGEVRQTQADGDPSRVLNAHCQCHCETSADRQRDPRLSSHSANVTCPGPGIASEVRKPAAPRLDYSSGAGTEYGPLARPTSERPPASVGHIPHTLTSSPASHRASRKDGP